MKSRHGLTRVVLVLIILTAMAISLTPCAAQAGEAVLSWSPPTTYSDGTPMTEIAGYKIHYGTTSCSYRQHIDAGNVTSYTVANLTDGTAYYFAITAYDTSGAESRYSKEVYKILPPVITHTITATFGSGGSIFTDNSNSTTQKNGNTTTTTVTVNDGADQLFTIVNQLGYAISDVVVDGSSVGSVFSYTFTNVKADHTLSATFVPASYTIVATAGSGGSITPSGSRTLPAGSNQAYSIAAAAGYRIADVKVDGVSFGPVATYSFSNLTANHTIAATFSALGYSIVASAGPGGSITPSGNNSIPTGTSQTYTITADSGYTVADVKVDGVSVGAVTTYTFDNISANHTIQVTFSAVNYTITASAGTGGSITPSGATTVPSGANQTFTIAAAPGYNIADVKVDDVSVGTVATYTFTTVMADHVIDATFTTASYTITASAGAGGSIAPSGATPVSYGGNQTFEIAASAGYEIADVTVDGASIGAAATYTFSNVTANHTIQARFSSVTYTITSSAGTGGSINPSGSTTVASGGSQSYTITAANGYSLADVKVDGTSVGALSSYTFDNVSANHTIQATFSAITYTITASAGTGGSIAPSGSTTVVAGANESFTITAATGYGIADVKVDGATVGAVSTYTFSSVSANHTIEATFSAITYTITASAGSGGSITPSGGTTVASGANQTYSITAAAGYSIADVKVDGISAGAISAYTFTNVTANHTIQASFIAITYTVTASAGTGGSITPSGSTIVSYGVSQSYTITAATGYRIADVKVDGVSVGAVSAYTLTNVTANHTIQASFSAITYTVTASAGTGGSITPAGSTTVTYGASQSYTITAATGYRIADVKVDGTSVGAIASYTFTNVTANHTIDATFTLLTYTITASAGTRGTITPSGSSTVAYGSSQSYAIAASAGYIISDVRVDNVSVGRVTSYTFTNVTANHTIQATFASTTPFAVNSGGPQYVSASGVTYSADVNFTGGSASTTTATIKGTTDGLLYQSSRQGTSFSYRIPLPNGSYNVTFKFAETQYTAAKKRVFSVSIGSTTVISNLDIYAKVGANAAYDVTVPATVTNRALAITFSRKNANATVSGIRVALPGTAQATPTGNVLVAANGEDSGLIAAVISDAASALLWQRTLDWSGNSGTPGVSSSATSSTPRVTYSVAVADNAQHPSKLAAPVAVAENVQQPSKLAAPVAVADNAQQPSKLASPAMSAAIYALPADRSVTWTGNVGVLGDIPTRTTICATVAPSGADDTSAIQAAIDNCQADQVVALNSGTYNISRAITVKSDVTLRGAGMGSTIIKGAAGMGGVYLVGFNANPTEGASVATTDLAKGSATVTTTLPHGWSVGDLVLIDQLNNPTGDPVVTNIGYSGTCFWCGRASGTRTLGQIGKVIDIPTPTTATFEIPFYWNYVASLSPQGTVLNRITTRAGVEDMTVDNSASGSSTQANDGATLVMYGASNCWFLRVEAIGSYETLVRIKRGYRNTIRGSRFHEGTPALPPDGTSYNTSRAYGIWINPGSANLIEDNQIYHLAMPVVLNSVSSGNVIAYNYITRLYYSTITWNIAAINFHGGHPYMNLVEGNHGEGRLQPDDVWGSSSHNTFFRNRETLAPDKTGARWDVDLAKNAQYYNIIANVLGTSGLETVYMLNNVNLTSAGAIYRLGYTTDGDRDAAGNDPQVAATLLLQGNWDSVNNGTVWNASGQQPLPASMYLTEKPAWWGEMQWPAVGPDVSPMYPAAPGICNGMPWDDESIPSSAVPSPPPTLTVQ